MNILHIVPSIGPNSFGLAQVALNLAKAQLEQKHNPVIWSNDTEEDRQWCLETHRLPNDLIRCFGLVGPRSICWSPSIIQAAKQKVNKFNIVHQHGIWTLQSRVTNLLRKLQQLPTVVAPHGALESSMLRKSGVKKSLALCAYECKNLQCASCIQATAPNEAIDIIKFGLRNPIALIPNGISRSWLESAGDGNHFRSKYKLPNNRRIFLFMSRIAPKKGLSMLLKSWSQLCRLYPEWILVVIGGDEDNYKQKVIALAKKLNLIEQVRFLDPVIGCDKRDAFSAAELFVLPSHSEGFPIVVLEALGAGLPAIVTKASEWKNLETHGCGWWVDISTEGIQAALQLALSCTSIALSKMGNAGRSLVETEYYWLDLSSKSIELYNWILLSGTRPSFVTLSKPNVK